MDIKKVTAAVKILISLDRRAKKDKQLHLDLIRLKSSMTTEEYTEYMKRIAR